jgi:Uma2 family endonuclease
VQSPSIHIPVVPDAPPDHTQLPDKDGAIVTNYQEHPQSILLTESLWPRLCELYGDRFSVGCDSGIYWRHTDPPLNGCKAPAWFLVPGVPRLLDGQARRSYVLWKEAVKPLVVIEYVSGDGSEEHDATPYSGKFWVYEQGIGAWYYAIFDANQGTVEVFRLMPPGRYQRLDANPLGRISIEPLGVELGVWQGTVLGMNLPWLRAWDAATGRLLPTAEECEEAERSRAEAAEALIDDAKRMRDEETERAEKERKRADRLAEKLRELGTDPDSV